MDAPVFDRIELTDPVTLPVWEPVLDEDGVPKHALIRIEDEVMEVHASGPGWALVKRGGDRA